MTKMVFFVFGDYTHNQRMQSNTQNTGKILAVFIELCKLIPAYLTSKIATSLRNENPDIDFKVRTFSLWCQVVSMLYCHVAHCLSLNDVCDSLYFHRAELNSLRNATEPYRTTLSRVNRTREIYSTSVLNFANCSSERIRSLSCSGPLFPSLFTLFPLSLYALTHVVAVLSEIHVNSAARFTHFVLMQIQS